MKLSHNDDPVVIPHCFTFHHTLHLTFLFLRNIRSCNQRAFIYLPFFLMGVKNCWSHLKVTRHEYDAARNVQFYFSKVELASICIKMCEWNCLVAAVLKSADYTLICPHACLLRPQCVIVAYSQDWCAHRLASVLPAVERTQFHGHKGHRKRSHCL